MRKVVRKFFFIWDFDKEEKWLNEMADEGWCLVSVGFNCYEFEQCLPCEYIFRIELLKHNHRRPESIKYLDFLKETGIEIVALKNPKVNSRFVRLRKKKNDGAFELFSDNNSRIVYLTRVMRNFALVAVIFLVLALCYSSIAFLAATNFSATIGFSVAHGLGFWIVVCLLIAVFCVYGFIKTYKKRKKLKDEQKLFE